jgi:hypothetical protein
VTHRRDVVLAAALSVFERLEPQRSTHDVGPALPHVMLAPTSWTPPLGAKRPVRRQRSRIRASSPPVSLSSSSAETAQP